MASPLPPPADPDRLTKVGFEQASSICTTQHLPLIMNGVCVRLMQEHFSSPRNLVLGGQTEIGADQLKDIIWTKDAATTRILIDMLWQYRVQDIQRRPAILVKRNDWTPGQRLGINDGMGATPVRDRAGKIIEVRGAKHSKLIGGSHTFFCIGGTGAAAELVGGEVWDYLMSFAPILRADFDLHRVEIAELKSPQLIDESTEHWVVSVVLAYAFVRTWTLEIAAPWLASLVMQMNPRAGAGN